MNTKIKTFAVSLVLLGSLLSPSAALAESHPTREPKPKCDEVQHKIENRLQVYKTNRDNHIAKYNRIVDKSEKLIEKLREKGYDETLVSQFETDLKTLRDMIHDFGSDVDAAMKALESANDFNCGDSEGEFARRLEEARGLMKIARDEAAAIRDFVKGTLKADIEALKASKHPTPVAAEVSPIPVPTVGE